MIQVSCCSGITLRAGIFQNFDGGFNSCSFFQKAKTLPLAFPAQPFRYIKHFSTTPAEGNHRVELEHRPRYTFGGVQRSDRERPSELLREGNPKPTSGHLSRDGKTIRANTTETQGPIGFQSREERREARRSQSTVPTSGHLTR